MKYYLLLLITLPFGIITWSGFDWDDWYEYQMWMHYMQANGQQVTPLPPYAYPYYAAPVVAQSANTTNSAQTTQDTGQYYYYPSPYNPNIVPVQDVKLSPEYKELQNRYNELEKRLQEIEKKLQK